MRFYFDPLLGTQLDDSFSSTKVPRYNDSSCDSGSTFPNRFVLSIRILLALMLTTHSRRNGGRETGWWERESGRLCNNGSSDGVGGGGAARRGGALCITILIFFLLFPLRQRKINKILNSVSFFFWEIFFTTGSLHLSHCPEWTSLIVAKDFNDGIRIKRFPLNLIHSCLITEYSHCSIHY